MRRYTFTCEDTENGTVTTIELNTENDSWTGIDGPMWKFHDFLRGCGFAFKLNDQIGIMQKDGKFIPTEL